MKKITDKQRLDWLEKQSGGNFWIARQSTTGRGFRLHNCHELMSARRTAREAIDAAMQASPADEPTRQILNHGPDSEVG